MLAQADSLDRACVEAIEEYTTLHMAHIELREHHDAAVGTIDELTIESDGFERLRSVLIDGGLDGHATDDQAIEWLRRRLVPG